MKTYTQSEIKSLKTRVFSAMTASGSVQVKAYLKSNAFRRLQEVDDSINESGVRLSKSINSHQCSCDEIVELGFGEYEIQYCKD